MPDPRDELVQRLAAKLRKESPAVKALAQARQSTASDTVLDRVLAALGVIESAGTAPPPIPLPTGSRVLTGHPKIDRASAQMPYEQRRELDRMQQAGRVHVAPLNAQPGNYTLGTYSVPSDRLFINSETLGPIGDEPLAQLLTHEATHSMQPQPGFWGRLMRRKPTIDPVTGYQPVGNAYLDDPREVEARRAAETIVQR